MLHVHIQKVRIKNQSCLRSGWSVGWISFGHSEGANPDVPSGHLQGHLRLLVRLREVG